MQPEAPPMSHATGNWTPQPVLPLSDDPYRIRTPRRPGGHAAQVWVDAGCWVVGLFPSRHAAREAARAFAALEPTPGVCGQGGERWFRRRTDLHAPSRRWVREVKGGAFQSRYWLECVGGSLNLGLFTLPDHNYDRGLAEWSAARASKAFRELWCGRVTVGQAVEQLKRKGWVPPGVVVPAKWAGLTLPTDYGPTEFAHERRERVRRERERERYSGRDLFTQPAA